MKKDKFFAVMLILYGFFMICVFFMHKNLPETESTVIAIIEIIVGIILVVLGARKIDGEKKKDS